MNAQSSWLYYNSYTDVTRLVAGLLLHEAIGI